MAPLSISAKQRDTESIPERDRTITTETKRNRDRERERERDNCRTLT